MKRQLPDQEQTTAAVTAAIAVLAPHAKSLTFESAMESKELAIEAGLLMTTPGGGQHLIDKAIAGDAMIDGVLHKVIRKILIANVALRPNLQRYLVDHILLVDRNNSGGRPAADFFARDTVIYMAVETVMAHGFCSTRNASTQDSSGGESACSIVSDALIRFDVELTEKSVAAIWQRLRKQCGKLSDLMAVKTSA